jgi:hypothetical protein
LEVHLQVVVRHGLLLVWELGCPLNPELSLLVQFGDGGTNALHGIEEVRHRVLLNERAEGPKHTELENHVQSLDHIIQLDVVLMDFLEEDILSNKDT